MRKGAGDGQAEGAAAQGGFSGLKGYVEGRGTVPVKGECYGR